ncbi:hypothetical protein [Micromonospora sp. WMMD737]|uniref:hypothetical protein n=1 Tax=Micromonospora sp. WMMD737 TaxID=3404113 RepID=UPI003B93117B
MARTSTMTMVGGMLAARSRSVTVSSSLLATQLRPPVRQRSASWLAAAAAGCAALSLFTLYGLLAAPAISTQDTSAALFMVAVFIVAAALLSVVAAARWLRTRQSSVRTARAFSVWREGTWCTSCHYVTLAVPGTGRSTLVSADNAHRAIHSLASISASTL